MTKNFFEINKVDFSVGGKTKVKNVSFSIEKEGDVICLLGPLSRRCRRRVVAFFCKRPLERRADLALKSAETSAARAVLIKAAQPSGRHACRASAQAVLASLDGLCAELSRVIRRR